MPAGVQQMAVSTGIQKKNHDISEGVARMRRLFKKKYTNNKVALRIEDVKEGEVCFIIVV